VRNKVKAAPVASLRVETDPKARLYLRKKAFLFGPQVKAGYGSDGWACTQAELAAGEEPVGGVHVKEKCTKTTQGRALTVERNLFRKAGQDEKNFVDETRVTILRARMPKAGWILIEECQYFATTSPSQWNL
jgi:hypothetical protein